MDFPRDLIQIDPRSRLPLYDQIEQNLSEMIINGSLPFGQSLPGEHELAELYGVSRLTVRKALDNLARQNWVVRKRGLGTYVSRPHHVSIAPMKLSFTEEMLAIGRTPGSRLLDLRKQTADERLAGLLAIHPGDPVIVLKRVRLANNLPILLETSYLPAEKFPGLENETSLTTGSLYALLEAKYQVKITGMDQTLKPVLLTNGEAEVLEVDAGSPAIASEIVAYSTDGDPVEYSWSVTSGDKCEFYFRFRHGE